MSCFAFNFKAFYYFLISALSFPLSWFIPPTLVQSDTLVPGCSHWRQVSHHLLWVNHVYLFYLTLTFFLLLSLCNESQNFGREGQPIQFLCKYDKKQIDPLQWMAVHHQHGSKSNSLVLQRLHVLCGSVDFTIYRSPSPGNGKKKQSKPRSLNFSCLTLADGLLNICWWVFQVLRAATGLPLI